MNPIHTCSISLLLLFIIIPIFTYKNLNVSTDSIHELNDKNFIFLCIKCICPVLGFHDMVTHHTYTGFDTDQPFHKTCNHKDSLPIYNSLLLSLNLLK